MAQENIQIIIPTSIIHRRFLITTDINNTINHNNLCIECTFLKDGGEVNENQKLRLYHIRDVVSYITRKQDNLVVCQIHK